MKTKTRYPVASPSPSAAAAAAAAAGSRNYVSPLDSIPTDVPSKKEGTSIEEEEGRIEGTQRNRGEGHPKGLRRDTRREAKGMDGRRETPRTLNSFWECVAIGMYNNTKRYAYIRSTVWDVISTKFFGCNVENLTKCINGEIEESIPKGASRKGTSPSFGFPMVLGRDQGRIQRKSITNIPRGDRNAWKLPSAKAWVDSFIEKEKEEERKGTLVPFGSLDVPSNSLWISRSMKGRIEGTQRNRGEGRIPESRGSFCYKKVFMEDANQFMLARYIIRQSMEFQSPNVMMIGDILCTCFNVSLVVFGLDRSEYPMKGRRLWEKGKVTFKPDGFDNWNDKEVMIYIHLLKDGNYWDLLTVSSLPSLRTQGSKGIGGRIPKTILHKFSNLGTSPSPRPSPRSVPSLPSIPRDFPGTYLLDRKIQQGGSKGSVKGQQGIRRDGSRELEEEEEGTSIGRGIQSSSSSSSSSSSRRRRRREGLRITTSGSVFQIRVFDGKTRTSTKVGDMIAPAFGNRVHVLEIDAKTVKDHWVFTLWKEIKRPGEQFSDKDIWIFAKRDNIVYWISVWKSDLTRPSFMINPKETAIYVIEAGDKQIAAACVRKEMKIVVKTELPPPMGK